jgi:HEAT repeat protein
MSQKKIELGAQVTLLAGILAHLQDEPRVLSRPQLTGLSDLGQDDLKLFKAGWSNLSAERKCAILSLLHELAEDNIEYDFSAVFKHALGDADNTVQQKAIEGLWENEESSLINPLIRILTEGRAEAVREAAAIALGRFTLLAECRKIEIGNVTQLSPPLLAVANDPVAPLPVRCRALEAVAPLSLADVTQAIWAAYRYEEPEMCTSAIRAMGLNRDSLWLPTIIQELASDNPEIRCAAAGAAGDLGEAEATSGLIDLLDDPDPEVRLAAVQALGAIGGIEAKQALRHLLQHEDQPLREAAANALTEIELFDAPLSPPPMDGD